MMSPPFGYLTKGQVGNQAMRDSHPHVCAQVVTFDGVTDICADAVLIKRMARLQSAAVPFLALGSASDESAAATPFSGGHW
jgi:hypothetical protein